ncbi:MAG: hypothetical protein D6741_18915, partial [Planctomycetota bacterium]
MIDQAKLKAIHDWISNETGLLFVWADQNAPRPNEAYITGRIQTIVRIGQDEVNAVNIEPAPAPADVETSIIGNRDITLRLEAFAEGDAMSYTVAFEALAAVQSSLHRPSVQDALRDAGLVYRNDFGIQNVSVDQGQSIELRASLDVVLGSYAAIVEQVGAIESTAIDRTI